MTPKPDLTIYINDIPDQYLAWSIGERIEKELISYLNKERIEKRALPDSLNVEVVVQPMKEAHEAAKLPESRLLKIPIQNMPGVTVSLHTIQNAYTCAKSKSMLLVKIHNVGEDSFLEIDSVMAQQLAEAAKRFRP